MLNRKSLLLVIASCVVFHTVFPAPSLFASLKNAVRHIRCGLHKVANKLIPHEHKHNNPCEPHYIREKGMTISNNQRVIELVSENPKEGISGRILAGSGFDSVELHTEKSIIKNTNFGGDKPRDSLVESTPMSENTPSTTSNPQESNEIGETWMFKEKCKGGQIATAHGCKDLALIKEEIKSNQLRK